MAGVACEPDWFEPTSTASSAGQCRREAARRTMLFFAALHQWPPDGRRWQREDLDKGVRNADPAPAAGVEPLPGNDVTRASSRVRGD